MGREVGVCRVVRVVRRMVRMQAELVAVGGGDMFDRTLGRAFRCCGLGRRSGAFKLALVGSNVRQRRSFKLQVL